jgi:hypothetical protein
MRCCNAVAEDVIDILPTCCPEPLFHKVGHILLH